MLLPFLEHGLEARQAHRQQPDAQPVHRLIAHFLFPVLGQEAMAMSTAIIPIGMLMKKIQRQPKRIGQIPAKHRSQRRTGDDADAEHSLRRPLLFRGKVSKRMDCALASSPPPARPCNTRATTSIVRFPAMPHNTDAERETDQ